MSVALLSMRDYEAYNFPGYFLRGFSSIFLYIFGFDCILNAGVDFFAYVQLRLSFCVAFTTVGLVNPFYVFVQDTLDVFNLSFFTNTCVPRSAFRFGEYPYASRSSFGEFLNVQGRG